MIEESTTELDPPWSATTRMRDAATSMAATVRARLARFTPTAADEAAFAPTFDRPRVAPRPPTSALAVVSELHGRVRGPHFVALPVFFADVLSLAFAGGVALALVTTAVALPRQDLPAVLVALALPILVGNLLTGLYPGSCANAVVELRQLSRVWAIAFLGVASFAALAHLGRGWFLFLAIAGPLQFASAPVARFLVRRVCRSQAWWGYPVLVFGDGPVAAALIGRLNARPECGLRPAAILAFDAVGGATVGGVPVVGTPRLAAVIAKRLQIRHAIVALPDLPRRASMRVLERYGKGIRHLTMTSSVSPFAPGLPLLWRDGCDLAGVSGVEVRNRLLVPTPRLIKRSIDVALTLAGGLCLLPILAALAIAVRRSSPGPVFFGHVRIGRRGQRFTAWKFRSMVCNGADVLRAHLAADPVAADEWARDHKLKRDPRVTRIGALLRRTSLDELPQLWNVLRGDMSLVGPRPIVDEEIAKYGKCYATYKSVRPGITGLWQVSGRNDTTYGERLQFDEYYVRNWSPWLDMNLLARTATALGGSKGAY